VLHGLARSTGDRLLYGSTGRRAKPGAIHDTPRARVPFGQRPRGRPIGERQVPGVVLLVVVAGVSAAIVWGAPSTMPYIVVLAAGVLLWWWLMRRPGQAT